MRRDRLRRWGIIAAVWTVFGVLAAAQHNLNYDLQRGTDLPITRSLMLFLPVAACWALATPFILRLARRFPFERGRWVRSLPVHAAFATALISVLALGYAANLGYVLPSPATERPLLTRAAQMWVAWMFWDGILYCAIVGIGEAVYRQGRLRRHELNAAKLEAQLAQAELQALRMQLHPHFLFNALHTIGSLVRTGDRDNAVRVVTGLGDLLRRVLDEGARNEVRLADELVLIRNYLDIERVRFSDRLSVEIDAPNDVLDAMVPHLILQPLVENAIRHGIAPHRRAGRLLIAAHRENGSLRLLVRDDGPGNGGGPSSSSGIGLANTRARLERLYGADCELSFGPAEVGGHEARVRVPYHVATGGPEA